MCFCVMRLLYVFVLCFCCNASPTIHSWLTPHKVKAHVFWRATEFFKFLSSSLKMAAFSKFAQVQLLRNHSIRTALRAHNILFANRRRGREYVRKVNLHRCERGEFASLIQELRQHDPKRHFTYFRMSVERFDYLPALLKKDL